MSNICGLMRTQDTVDASPGRLRKASRTTGQIHGPAYRPHRSPQSSQPKTYPCLHSAGHAPRAPSLQRNPTSSPRPVTSRARLELAPARLTRRWPKGARVSTVRCGRTRCLPAPTFRIVTPPVTIFQSRSLNAAFRTTANPRTRELRHAWIVEQRVARARVARARVARARVARGKRARRYCYGVGHLDRLGQQNRSGRSSRPEPTTARP